MSSSAQCYVKTDRPFDAIRVKTFRSQTVLQSVRIRILNIAIFSPDKNILVFVFNIVGLSVIENINSPNHSCVDFYRPVLFHLQKKKKKDNR